MSFFVFPGNASGGRASSAKLPPNDKVSDTSSSSDDSEEVTDLTTTSNNILNPASFSFQGLGLVIVVHLQFERKQHEQKEILKCTTVQCQAVSSVTKHLT